MANSDIESLEIPQRYLVREILFEYVFSKGCVVVDASQGCSSSSVKIKKKKKKILAAKKDEEKILAAKKDEELAAKKQVDEKRVRCRYSVSDPRYFFPEPETTFIKKEWQLYGKQKVVKPPKEKYSDELNDVNVVNAVEGERLEVDVYELLSNTGKDKEESYLVRNNGEKVGLIDAIAGKYLFICCFYVPALVDVSDVCRALIASYSELKAKGVNIEMVVVAKMRTAFIAEDEEKPAFNHFFSEFPCLAVPFDDSSSREFICKRLGLGNKKDGYDDDACFVLDPYQNVLQTTDLCFLEYGAAAFPYTEAQLSSIEIKDDEMMMRLDPVYRELYTEEEVSKPIGLDELLFCKPDLALDKCDGSGEKMSVSELSNKKCVGLYLCADAEFMDSLHELERKCVEQGKEFEIVIVCQPKHCHRESSYFRALELTLKEKKITSWWVMPFVDEVSRGLSRIANCSELDGLIIWADGGTTGEFDGMPFIKRFGFDSYPFSKKALLDSRFSTLRSFTTASFLGGATASLLPGTSSLNVTRVSDLEKHNVLLYFASSSSIVPKFHKWLRDCYNQIKVEYKCEVVFIPWDDKVYEKQLCANVPWPRLPKPIANPPLPYVLGVGDIVMITFGSDNQMKSIRAIDKVEDAEDGNLFADTLWEDIFHDLCYELDLESPP